MIKHFFALGVLAPVLAYSNSYIVKLKSNKSTIEFNQYGKVSEIKTKTLNFIKISSENNLSGIQIDRIRQNQNVEYIEENQIYKTQDHIDDPEFSKQWSLKNTGRNSGSFFSWGKIGEDVDAIDAWEMEQGSKNIKIAVIDTGVDYTHPDLIENMWKNQLELNGTEGVDDDGNGYIDDINGWDFVSNDNDPMDGNGHGTHCAGVIAASHNNIGIRGLMREAQVIPLKFLADNGSGTLDGAIKAISYATNIGVHIMSNSWGGGGFSQALYDVIEEAQNEGILFVAAAGNSRNDNDKWASYPATYELDNIISVGASDGKGKKARFSNYGKTTVDLFAPGVDIHSTYKNKSYKKLSGTSMATPIVSGVLGLMMSQGESLGFTELKQKIMDSTDQSRSLGSFSVAGRVNAKKALQ
jgi:thermitase